MTIQTSNDPVIIYQSRYTALATWKDKSAKDKWCEKNRDHQMFTKLATDPLGEPDRFGLRVRDGYKPQNIQKILSEYNVKMINTPPKDFAQWFKDHPEQQYHIGYNRFKDLSRKNSYTIEKLISSSGGWGDVFLARDVETEQRVAIKILRNHNDREDSILEEIREASQKMWGTDSHPNIVEYLGAATTLVEKGIWDRTWIVMEYIEGETRIQFEKHSKWTEEHERQYKDALRFLRRIGITQHRENELENVMITKDGTVKLIDFGTLALQ